VYVALPNGHHREWTQRALLAGKAVLCEKPLCVDAAETAAVLEIASQAAAPLWEAFVFPFSVQQQGLRRLIAEGAIGSVGELHSTFHFPMRATDDIRLSADLGGGALADVGCYPVRFAHEVFADGPAPETEGSGPAPLVSGTGTVEGSVETEASGVVAYGGRRLLLSCGFRLARNTDTVLLGTEGSIHLSNAFHPRPPDTVTLVRTGDAPVVERPSTNLQSFSPALNHIHRVLLHGDAPEHLALDSSLRTATVLDALRRAVRAGSVPTG